MGQVFIEHCEEYIYFGTPITFTANQAKRHVKLKDSHALKFSFFIKKVRCAILRKNKLRECAWNTAISMFVRHGYVMMSKLRQCLPDSTKDHAWSILYYV